MPSLSFDLDGDGVVGQRDMYLATRFDSNQDGILDETERKATMDGTYVSKDGLTIANTAHQEDLKDVVANGELPPYSAMTQRKRQEMKSYAVALGDKQERGMNDMHESCKQNITNTYPWTVKSQKGWGKSMALDKITASYPEEESYNNTHFGEFPVRTANSDYATESTRIGEQGYTRMAAEEWNMRKKNAHGKVQDIDTNTRILNMTQRRAPLSYKQTFENVIGRPGGPAYALSPQEWKTTTQELSYSPSTQTSRRSSHRFTGQFLGGSSRQVLSKTVPASDMTKTNPYIQAKDIYGGKGAIRANHIRYGAPQFNNGNELVDNVVGFSKFASPHYMPYNSNAIPLA